MNIKNFPEEKMIRQEKQIVIDADGNESTTIKETTLQRTGEPDYIKLYTKVWLEFNQIPMAYRNLFLELVQRMTYCNSNDLENAQLVNTGKPYSDSIKANLGWGDSMYKKGLKVLCESGAIRKVARAVYQINPSYAGKGDWRYNPHLARGGVKDLKAVFDFVQGTVDTEIIFADDGTDTDINKFHRNGLGVKKSDETVLYTQTKKVVSE